jgi:hypothetical protein
MSIELSRFRHAILAYTSLAPHDKALQLERDGRLTCHYAPFEHVNRGAKVVLVGITPGAQQARNALNALRDALASGASDANALAAAKRTASFSGSMRSNLIAMLDRVGLHAALGLDSCEHLFGNRGDLAHFTSILRNPVFLDGADYSGTPSILATPALRRMGERWFSTELDALPDALWVPLGKEPCAVLQDFVRQGRLRAGQVLDGLPHPSGANAERIAYFLGTKPREALSAKTDAVALDARRTTLCARIAATRIPTAVLPAATQDQSLAAAAPSLTSAMSMASPVAPPVAPRAHQAKAGTNSRHASTFCLEAHDGSRLFPTRIQARGSSTPAFQLAPRGAGTHTKEFRIEVEDEVKACEMVASGTYKIRATTGNGAPPSLLGLNDRVVRRVVKLEGA